MKYILYCTIFFVACSSSGYKEGELPIDTLISMRTKNLNDFDIMLKKYKYGNYNKSVVDSMGEIEYSWSKYFHTNNNDSDISEISFIPSYSKYHNGIALHTHTKRYFYETKKECIKNGFIVDKIDTDNIIKSIFYCNVDRKTCVQFATFNSGTDITYFIMIYDIFDYMKGKK